MQHKTRSLKPHVKDNKTPSLYSRHRNGYGYDIQYIDISHSLTAMLLPYKAGTRTTFQNKFSHRTPKLRSSAELMFTDTNALLAQKPSC